MCSKCYRKTAGAAVLLLLASTAAAGAQSANPVGFTAATASAPDTTTPAFTFGAAMGDSTAAKATEFRWFGRGFIAGALTGPLGTWWAVKRAGRSHADSPSGEVELASSDPAYRQGYEHGYAHRIRSERREYAFMGGALGTAAFAYALIRIAKLQDNASSSGAPGDGGPQLVRIPLVWR